MEEKHTINSIILLDDNPVTNYLHKKIIDDLNLGYSISTFTSANILLQKMKSLLSPEPSLYLIDMNMPTVDAWEFLEAYEKLPKKNKNSESIIILLTTSILDEELEKANNHPLLKRVIFKPLTEKIISEFFS